MTQRWLSCVLALAVLNACTVGPDYTRPDVGTPQAFRFAVNGESGNANVAWWTQFGDKTLVSLIDQALANNWDLKIAAAQVDQAAALLVRTNSQLMPSVTYGATAERARVSEVGGVKPGETNPASEINPYIGAGWELDLWGRVRRQSEAANANLVGAEEARRGVILTLVAAVATTYLQLRALDAQRAIAQESLADYNEQLTLFKERYSYGQISEVTLSQMQAQYETAAAVIPRVEEQISKTENALSLLTGTAPRSIPRGKSFDAIRLIGVPSGLPSDLLTRRPDVAQAEQNLIAANANIGAAEALYFPRLSLTGQAGTTSNAMNTLLTKPASEWSVAADLTGPIFNGGLITGQVFVTQAQKNAALAQYQQTILNAFREVSDGLVGYSQSKNRLAAENRLVEADATTARLAYLSFQEGAESYTTVLVAQNDLLDARLSAVQTRFDAFASLVQVYKAMGGGWVDVAAAKVTVPASLQPTDTAIPKPPKVTVRWPFQG